MASLSFQLEFRTIRNESALQIDTDLWCLWLMLCWASCGKSVDFGFWKEVVELYKHVHHISSTHMITSEVRISKSGRLRVVWNVFSIASWQKTHVFSWLQKCKSKHLKVRDFFLDIQIPCCQGSLAETCGGISACFKMLKSIPPKSQPCFPCQQV